MVAIVLLLTFQYTVDIMHKIFMFDVLDTHQEMPRCVTEIQCMMMSSEYIKELADIITESLNIQINVQLIPVAFAMTCFLAFEKKPM